MIKFTKYILIEYWMSTNELIIKYTKYILIEYWTSTDELKTKCTRNIFFNLILNEY